MKHLLSILAILFTTTIMAQVEICNNSIDDDGDGLIDIQDTDCDCDQILPSGLIPNESFEIMECCPNGEAEFQCATSWEQAAPTSDYFHTCGITFPNWIFPTQQPPQPLPDGQGYVGFRDGKRPGRPNYKEYVGACLTDEMEVGKVYTLDFFLGFPLSGNSIDMTIYATTECSNLPFTTQFDTGCPTNNPSWDVLDAQFIQGDNEWVNVIFDLVADKPYTAIILGSGCDANPNFENDPYFFVDRLNLVEKVEGGLPFTEIEGSLCEDEVTLELDLGDEFGYQWYKDGIAMLGEESNTITLQVNGQNVATYSVVISTPAGCVLSEEFDLTPPVLFSEQEATICEGEVYSFGDQQITTAGLYTQTLISVQGCDSIVALDLMVQEASSSSLTPTICDGEEFEIDGDILTESGNYFYTFPTDDDCDSIVTVVLNVLEAATRTEQLSICEGDPFSFEGQNLTTTGIYPFFYTQPNGCDSTFIIDLTVNQVYSEQSSATLCEGEVLQFGNEMISVGGTYTGQLSTVTGCDSNVVLEVELVLASFSQIEETICEGESYLLEGEAYNNAGSYQAFTTNSVGCDSTIFLELEMISWDDGISLPSDTVLNLGSDFLVTPDYIAPEFQQTVWLNELGEVLSNDATLQLTGILERQEISISAVDEFGCVDEDQIVIRVNRNIGVYAPNIFSPNGDTANDFFRPVVNESIESLKEINVYDRWGNLVYHEESITDLPSWQGWDGRYNNQLATSGVYVYSAIFIALDGVEESIAGDITLIR